MFTPARLSLARKRRKYTAKILAELADVAPLTITRLEKGENAPDTETVARLANALNYPIEFFYRDEPETVETDAVSFRSLTRMSAKEREAALGASSLGIEFVGWVEERFKLPDTQMIDLSYETDPVSAARQVRNFWSIGLRPIGDLISLLEHNGIRVLSLSEDTKTVDAFSFWRDEVPYIFLNNFKTAERSRFDAAHELGHLVLHRHAGRQQSKNAEREADKFAANFLMPPDDVQSRMPARPSVETILKAKKRWGVSALALATQAHQLGLISKYTYTGLCIELSKRGYRSGEPIGIPFEKSITWRKIFEALWEDRVTKNHIAQSLAIPLDEFEGLIWDLAVDRPPERRKASLKLVTDDHS